MLVAYKTLHSLLKGRNIVRPDEEIQKVTKMSRSKYGRHTPAFVLLFLAQAPAYGAFLLNRMKEELPFNFSDGPSLYRSLQDLEKDGAVEAYWDTTEPGPAKKWYRITSVGINKLEDFRHDIEMRKQNLEFFLDKYRELDKNPDNI